MKLSEAIVSGSKLKKSNPEAWISADGFSGCALGGALLATGVTAKEFREQWITHKLPEIPCIVSRWPWLTWDMMDEITRIYRLVAQGKASIQDVVAYVQGIEPKELPKPEEHEAVAH